MTTFEFKLIDAAEEDLQLGKCTALKAAQAIHAHIKRFAPHFKRSIHDIAETMLPIK